MESIHERSLRQAPVYSLNFDDRAGWTFEVWQATAGGYVCSATGPSRGVPGAAVEFNSRRKPTVQEAIEAAREWAEGFTAELDGGAA